MEPADTPPLSGSNAMCVFPVLLDTVTVPMQEPITRMVIEPLAGLIEAESRDGKVKRIHVHNVPSCADKLDADLEIACIGTVMVDTAHGGDSFVLADARALGLEPVPHQARDMARIGILVTTAGERLGFPHPSDDWSHIPFCQITDPVTDVDAEAEAGGKTAMRPVVSGRARVIVTKQPMVDHSDPFKSGHRLSDTWPMEGPVTAGTRS